MYGIIHIFIDTIIDILGLLNWIRVETYTLHACELTISIQLFIYIYIYIPKPATFGWSFEAPHLTDLRPCWIHRSGAAERMIFWVSGNDMTYRMIYHNFWLYVYIIYLYYICICNIERIWLIHTWSFVASESWFCYLKFEGFYCSTSFCCLHM